MLGDLVLTHDMLVEGVHFLAADPPGDVAWKLVAVNLSDLAAKGAAPLGVLIGYALGDDAWNAAFVDGLGEALRAFGVPLLGGDTVAMPSGSARAFGLTALGRAPGCGAPSRDGAKAGDRLWVTGTIGDAGLGLALALEADRSPAKAEVQLGGRNWTPALAGELLLHYRRPQPRLDAGAKLAPLVHAMADVSDGLLIDAARIAAASGLAVSIDLDAVPLSTAARAVGGEGRAARLAASAAGDDYQLLFAAPPEAPLAALGLDLSRVGVFGAGAGLLIHDKDGPVVLPERLGYIHGGAPPAAC